MPTGDIGEALGRDGLAGMREQRGQQRAAGGPAERRFVPVLAPRAGVTENPEPHTGIIQPGGASVSRRAP
ncbi:hypothetical protein [Actinomadura roseirufa]|uniref:hypothetical protein n=1 Tax=Actinomadura roseirufa TaxID=2094049 RepID=UPI0013F17DD4|nr:hypothetical protein [Actinomadura roseirufa]